MLEVDDELGFGGEVGEDEEQLVDLVVDLVVLYMGDYR